MAAANKQEKKIMDEKIAKVREVVRNFSTNDIILALHHFELDVEKTIQAFLHDGYKEALGDWVGTGAKKNNKQKKKTGGAAAPSSAKPHSSVSSSTAANGGRASSTMTIGTSSTPSIDVNNSVKVHVNDVFSLTKPKAESVKAAKVDVKGNVNGLSGHEGSAIKSATDKNPTFAKKADDARARISQCFQELRHALKERERQLLAELECYGETKASFTYDNAYILSVIQRIGDIHSGECEKAPLSEHIDAIPTTNGYTNDNARDAHLNGSLKATDNISAYSLDTTQHKQNASLPSNVENNGGEYAQSRPAAKQEKSVAHVADNGIVMQSDGFTAEQLAELQKRIQETLMSQGIDPSVLSVLNTSAPRRRPQKSGGGGGGSEKGGARNGGAGGGKNAGGKGGNQQSKLKT